MAVSTITKENTIISAYHPTVNKKTGVSPAQKPGDDEKNLSGDDKTLSRSESSKKSDAKSTSTTDNNTLTNQEKEQIEALRKRDQEVKDHEMAHVAAGGQYINGQVNYAYQTGPDGRRYAVGGDVSIDMSEVPGDPEATVRKMQAIRRAALAPASPSQTDRLVASKANQIEAKARMDVLLEKVQESDRTAAIEPKTNAKSGAAHYENQPNDIEDKGVLIDIAA